MSERAEAELVVEGWLKSAEMQMGVACASMLRIAIENALHDARSAGFAAGVLDGVRAETGGAYAAGLEAAAKVCESKRTSGPTVTPLYDEAWNNALQSCASAIRALPAAQRGDDKNTGGTPHPENSNGD